MLEDAVRACREQRLSEQGRRALVDRGGAHLHGRSEPTSSPTTIRSTPSMGEVRDLGGPRTREVDARLPGLEGGGPEIDPSTRSSPAVSRSAASARAVPGEIAFRSATRGRAADLACRTKRGRRRSSRAASGGAIERTPSASPTTFSRLGQDVEPGGSARPLRPRAASGEGDDNTRATASQRCADGASHRAWADDADGHGWKRRRSTILSTTFRSARKAMPTRSSSSSGTAATAARFASS